MDAELRGYLETFRQEILGRFDQVDGRITKEVVALSEEMQAGDRETRVLVEAVRGEVRAVGEGVSIVREMLGRSQEDQNREIDLRIGPLEAAVRSHSGQIQDHERRITALEGRGGR